MYSLFFAACAMQKSVHPPHPVHSQKVLYVGWHDELDSAANWRPLDMENKAHVYESSKGHVLLGLDHVPDGWPYTFRWSGVSQDVTSDLSRFPVLMASVDWLKGYAHLDIDVLDAQGKPVKTLRTSTLTQPGVSTLDLGASLDPAVYRLRLRLIVGGQNEGCSATYDWVRFVRREDVKLLTDHPDYQFVTGIPNGMLR